MRTCNPPPPPPRDDDGGDADADDGRGEIRGDAMAMDSGVVAVVDAGGMVADDSPADSEVDKRRTCSRNDSISAC